MLAVDEALQSAAAASLSEPVVSKLAVGVNIKLKGVDISDCDVLVIEGHVEATVHSKAMEIAMPGTLRGTAAALRIGHFAEIYHGEFSGDLTRARLPRLRSPRRAMSRSIRCRAHRRWGRGGEMATSSGWTIAEEALDLQRAAHPLPRRFATPGPVNTIGFPQVAGADGVNSRGACTLLAPR